MAVTWVGVGGLMTTLRVMSLGSESRTAIATIMTISARPITTDAISDHDHVKGCYLYVPE